MPTIALGLQHREQLSPAVAAELDQLVAAIQQDFNVRLPGPVRAARGGVLSLLLGLQFREQLDPIIVDELDQLVAAVQTAFNAQRLTWVKSVQPISIAMGGLTEGTVSLTKVDVNNAIISLGGVNGGGNGNTSISQLQFRWYLTDGTTATATRAVSSAQAVTVRATVTEFYPNLFQSIQRGTIRIDDGYSSATATITRVNAATVVVPTGWSCTVDDTANGWCDAVLSSSTVVTASRRGTLGTAIIAYEVREYPT